MKEQLAQWVRRFCLNSKQATPCDGEGEFSLREGSRRVIPGIGKGGASLGEESGKVFPGNWIQAFRKVLLVVQGLSPDWSNFPTLLPSTLGHLSLQKNDSISFMCSLSNLWCSVTATQSRARPHQRKLELQ